MSTRLREMRLVTQGSINGQETSILILEDGSELTDTEIAKINFFWYCCEGWVIPCESYLKTHKKVTSRAWYLASGAPKIYQLFLERGYRPKPQILIHLLLHSSIDGYSALAELLLRYQPHVNYEVDQTRNYEYVDEYSLRESIKRHKLPMITPLMAAVKSNSFSLARLILSLGADVNAQTSDLQQFALLNVKSTAMIKLLLDNNANCNLANHRGETILHHSCLWSSYEEDMLPTILPYCNVNAVDHLGRTPIFHIAIDTHQKYQKRIELLVSSGADINYINGTRTVFDYFRRYFDCADFIKLMGGLSAYELLKKK